jgi:uncharacterized coiled-coil protein SlyX
MKILIIASLALTFSVSTLAQQLCPLTNNRLSDLRSAASKLSRTITLSAECKAYQDTINQSNAQLKDIVNRIADADGKLGPNDTPDYKDTAAKAVSQLDTISSLFQDHRCTTQIVNGYDFANVFIDVSMSMVPFLARFGGPEAMPWVLGSAIAGAGAKTLIMFFRNKSIDMRNPDQSNTFLRNSCAFYQLNQVKDSLDDLEMRQSTVIEKDLQTSQEKLSSMKSLPVEEASSKVAVTLRQLEKDQGQLRYLQDQFRLDATEGCGYIRAFAAKEDPAIDGVTLVDRVWSTYEESVKDAFRLEQEKKFFIGELNSSVATGTDASRCNRWLTRMNAFIDAAVVYQRKLALDDTEIKRVQSLREERIQLEEAIKQKKDRVKFFDELTGSGFNIEFSEIIRSHQQVQDAIFDSHRWLKTVRQRGLAEAWLRVKLEDADREFESFAERRKELDQRLKSLEKAMGAPVSATNVKEFAMTHESQNKREHPVVTKNVLADVCSQLRRTWTSWYNGLIHAKAGREYCVNFERIINKLDYPAMQEICFGTTKRNGKKEVSSLRNQVIKFNRIKPEADQLLVQMRELSCKQSGELNPEILKTNF